jgi:hypothetical protein
VRCLAPLTTQLGAYLSDLGCKTALSLAYFLLDSADVTVNLVRRLSMRRRSSSDCWCRMSSFSAVLALSDQGFHVSTYPRPAMPIGGRARPPDTRIGLCRPVKRLISVLVLRSPLLIDRQADAIPSGVASASPVIATPTPIHRIQSDRVTPGAAGA